MRLRLVMKILTLEERWLGFQRLVELKGNRDDGSCRATRLFRMPQRQKKECRGEYCSVITMVVRLVLRRETA